MPYLKENKERYNQEIIHGMNWIIQVRSISWNNFYFILNHNLNVLVGDILTLAFQVFGFWVLTLTTLIVLVNLQFRIHNQKALRTF
jgi:hypothetical protein